MEVRYLLEIVRLGPDDVRTNSTGTVLRSIVLPHTLDYEKVRDSAITKTWTFGKTPIREHSGERERTFRLSGLSGVTPRLGQDRQGRDTFAAGHELYREFERFLVDYENLAYEQQLNVQTSDNFRLLRSVNRALDQYQLNFPAAQVQQRRLYMPEYRLVFRALFEEDSLFVEPVRLTSTRSMDLPRFCYRWALDFWSYGQAKAKPLDYLGQLEAIAQSSADLVDGLTVYVAQADRYLRRVNRTLESFREPVRSLRRLSETARRATIQAGRTIENLSYVEEIYHTAVEVAVFIANEWDGKQFPQRLEARAAMYQATLEAAGLRRKALNFLGQNRHRVSKSRQLVYTPGASPPTGAKPYRPNSNTRPLATSRNQTTARYVMQAGESLQDVAQRFAGDRGQWREILRLNHMTDPFTMPDGRPVGPGVALTVPAPTGGQFAERQASTELYGTDWLLGSDGDLVANGTTATDWKTVSGVDNLVQALTNRLLTVQGQNRVFPSFGLPRLVGEPNTAGTVGFVASHLRTQLESDPRIKTVRNVTVTDEGPRFIANAVVEPIVGSAIPITVPFER